MAKKICFAASSGGHFEQLLMLKPLMDKYDSFLITEDTSYNVNIKYKTYYIKQVNRKEKNIIVNMIINSIKSVYIYIKERPDVIITTGVLSVIPICFFAKLMGKRLIFIESYAKITSPTLTGKLLYGISDRFYVQWPQMKNVYPNAIYIGGIY